MSRKTDDQRRAQKRLKDAISEAIRPVINIISENKRTARSARRQYDKHNQIKRLTWTKRMHSAYWLGVEEFSHTLEQGFAKEVVNKMGEDKDPLWLSILEKKVREAHNEYARKIG